MKSLKLDPINRVSVVETVTERILSLIVSGEVKPGEKLPSEHELAARLGVGRSSIREVLRSLAIMGVVKTQSGRGTIVMSPTATAIGSDLKATITQWGLVDVFEVRLLIETEAAELAACKATSDEVVAIADIALSLEKKMQSHRSYFQDNLRFHLKIAEASHNPVLAHCLANIIGNLRDVREMATTQLRAEDDIEDHRKIVAALVSRRPQAARKAMRDHLARNIREITEAVKGRVKDI